MKGPKGSEWALGKEAACWAWTRKEVRGRVTAGAVTGRRVIAQSSVLPTRPLNAAAFKQFHLVFKTTNICGFG